MISHAELVVSSYLTHLTMILSLLLLWRLQTRRLIMVEPVPQLLVPSRGPAIGALLVIDSYSR